MIEKLEEQETEINGIPSWTYIIDPQKYCWTLTRKLNEIIDYLNRPLNKLVKEAYEQGLADARPNKDNEPGTMKIEQPLIFSVIRDVTIKTGRITMLSDFLEGWSPSLLHHNDILAVQCDSTKKIQIGATGLGLAAIPYGEGDIKLNTGDKLRLVAKANRPNPLLNDNPPVKKKRLDIKHVNNLLKARANTKLIKLINDNIEDPDSLFEPRFESNSIQKCYMDEGIPEFLIQKKEPKWKAGDEAWFIFLGAEPRILKHTLTEYGAKEANEGTDPNWFKSKELAEACLEEIKEVMRKYE